MKINKYFDIKEVVPKEIYNEYRDYSAKFINPKAVTMLENVREILGVPLICNTWASGGTRNYCGYRQESCPIGAKGSYHRKGMAFDLISKYMTAKEMRDKLEERQDYLIYPIRVEKWTGENEISWLHVDLGDTKGNKIYFFRT